MNQRSLRVLEWPKIKASLADRTSFSLGKVAAEELQPSSQFCVVTRLLVETKAGVTLLENRGAPPFGGVSDCTSQLRRVRRGGVLDAADLVKICGLLYCSHQMSAFLRGCDAALCEYGEQLFVDRKLLQSIQMTVDDEGFIRDGASRELTRIRQRQQTLAVKIRKKLDALIASPSVQKMLQEAIVTIRDGRYVVPVKQAYSHSFAGMVHGQSASGATVFIEPAVINEINNEIRLAEEAERREIDRILREISAACQKVEPQLGQALQTLVLLDLVFAKAKYARHLTGVMPTMNDKGVIAIRQGRHPLLQGKIVPIDVRLGQDFHQLVITGPNTGGKTVSLKTVGLFCLMAQAGLFVPAAEPTELSIFSGIYADIGDEQSIEQSLSTFSSHMENIVGILEQSCDKCLVLLDELGAGTDPSEGAALAMAILQFLQDRGCQVIATTHYSELMSYAFTSSHAENASVEFDVQTLSPTYRLSIGVPGRSNAFAIARRLGLPDHIVEAAKSFISGDQQQLGEMIGEIAANRTSAIAARNQSEIERREYERLRQKYASLTSELADNKQKILAAVETEAAEFLRQARKDIDQLMGQLRKGKHEDTEALGRQVRARLDKATKELTQRRQPQEQPRTPSKRLEPGELVRVKSVNQTGEIIRAGTGEEDILVQIGAVKLTVPRHQVERLSVADAKAHKSSHGAPPGVGGINRSKSETIRSEVSVRGLTVEEAIPVVEKYLDDALLASLAKVRIIHGKGTGALRNAITSYLKQHPFVESIELAAPGEGGLGVSVVRLAIR